MQNLKCSGSVTFVFPATADSVRQFCLSSVGQKCDDDDDDLRHPRIKRTTSLTRSVIEAAAAAAAAAVTVTNCGIAHSVVL